MATKLEQMKAEMEQEAKAKTAQGNAPVNADTATRKKSSWSPRWVAVMNADGTFAKFGQLTLTAPRNQVKLDSDGKPVAVNFMAGSTLIDTIEIPSDATVWSAISATNKIKKDLANMKPIYKVESSKDGSADMVTVRFGNNLELNIYVGGINNSVIPARIINKYGLVVFHAKHFDCGWVDGAKITNNFDEALDWIKANYTAPVDTPKADNSDVPF